MDITIDVNDYMLNVRASVIIIHNNKVLLHRNINSDHYALLGGRVGIGEDSESTAKREVKEELGKDIEIVDYFATIENLFEMKDKKYHEIMFVYKAEFADDKDKLIEDTLENIEGKDYLKYEWCDIDKIDEYNLKPKIMKKVLKEKDSPIHLINKD